MSALVPGLPCRASRETYGLDRSRRWARLMMDLTANSQVITGTWTEQTSPAGYY
jgi:hypothetical protein